MLSKIVTRYGNISIKSASKHSIYKTISIRSLASCSKYKHNITISSTKHSFKPTANLITLCSQRFVNTNTNNENNDDILDKNTQRSKDHRQEILENEYPDFETVSHPHSHHPPPPELDDTEYYVDKSRPKYEDYVLPHPIWTREELDNIIVTHKKPTRLPDHLAYITVGLMRFTWDLSTGYLLGRRLKLFKFSHRMWLLRVVFLETVAGVPGMMFGMVRHLHSLRRLERDRGWIKSLLSEAENERIHLLTAMRLYKPGTFMRYAIVIAQGLMCNFLFLAYLISPRYCHSLVGYLEEQAVHTYSNLLMDIEEGKYPEFEERASALSRSYWKLPKDATWKDVFENIRADESHHRDVNHTLADLADDPKALNPYRKVH